MQPMQQGCIPVRNVPSAHSPYRGWVGRGGGMHGMGVHVRGCAWQGGMCGRAGHVWQGSMHGKGGMHGRGHAWQGASMAGVCVARGHVWHACPPPPPMDRMTGVCRNITLRKLRLWAVMIRTANRNIRANIAQRLKRSFCFYYSVKYDSIPTSFFEQVTVST